MTEIWDARYRHRSIFADSLRMVPASVVHRVLLPLQNDADDTPDS
jgi:hypothetical protein